ncbi:hypothetical protein BYT27DRAFT_7185778 [Phlegmacium glaucopus]|nr:hypothetical protein BYT27DRAFT_7185778 [Phlegmacium glaucopus]
MFSKARILLSAVGRKGFPEEVNPFFSFTSGRWLCNNDAHLKSRYAPFNVDGLQRVASRTIGSQVQSMKKIAESCNRVFLVTFQNGQQVVASIPTTISGPSHFTTASEVATMDFLRRLGMPVPKVFAWSSRPQSTEVESEFIIMEKVEGEPLSRKVWETVDHVDLVHKLAQLHRPLLDLRFTHYGSIYYKGDIDASQRSTVDFLETVPEGVDISPFCMGPIARRDFWEDERASMEIDRGPWTSALEYMVDVVVREQTWIDRYVKPHLYDDFLCGLPLQGKQDDHIEVLEYYKYLLPRLVPQNSRYLHGHLWHPDLHSGNLFVIPSDSTAQDGKVQLNITSCIDWQGAWVGPAFLQLTVPEMYRATWPSEALSLPPHFDTLDAATQKEAKRIHNETVLCKLFESLALQDIVHLPALAQRRELEGLAQSTWRTGLLPFREVLINVCKRWNEIAPGHKCPIDFTPAECKEHAAAYAYWLKHQARASALYEEFSLAEFGYVAGDQAQFERVRTQLEKQRKEWEASGNTPEERMVKAILWPYRDTLSDNPRSHLKVDISTLNPTN